MIYGAKIQRTYAKWRQRFRFIGDFFKILEFFLCF